MAKHNRYIVVPVPVVIDTQAKTEDAKTIPDWSFLTVVEYLVDNCEQFLKTAKGLRTGDRLVALAKEKQAPGSVIEVHPDDHALLTAAANAPTNGFPVLQGRNTATGAPMMLPLGRKILPMIDAIVEASDEPPEGFVPTEAAPN